jgi:tetratricopeptide (TPR) repeat protein
MSVNSDINRRFLTRAIPFGICLFLVLTTLAVYYQVHGFDFVNYDDAEYVQLNPYIHNGITLSSVKWAFTTGYACFWHPLTWLSHMLDWQLFGANPAGHHITSVLFHVLNTLLVFLVFRQMTGSTWPSAFTAALFALHPLHVESVAWVSERKDVLSTFFWLLTMWAYVRYVRRLSVTRYLLVVVFFTMGMMSKPMLVTLPFVLLLLDYWPRNRLSISNLRLTIAEKVPLLVLAGVLSVVAYIAQKQGKAIPTGDDFAFPFRLANAPISYVQYIIKMFWPAELAMFYPHPGSNVSFFYAVLSALFLLALTILIIRFSRQTKYLFTGWFWYLGTLVPVIGLVQVGNHAFADRYSYITLTGLFIIIAWGLPDLLRRLPHRNTLLWVSSIAVLSALAVRAHVQTGYWKDTVALCERALKITENNYRAHFCITRALLDQRRFEEAIEHGNEAIRINPKCYEAYNNLGVALVRVGKFNDAISVYESVLEKKPDDAISRGNLAAIYVTQGRYAEAVEQCKISLETIDSIPIRKFLAYSLLKLGQYPSAISEYRNVLAAESNDPNTLNKLGFALAHDNQFEQAISVSNDALRISPQLVDARQNLGYAFIGQGRFAEAVIEYEQFLQKNPENALAHSELGVAFFKQGKLDEALAHFNRALQIDPNNTAVQANLDFAQAEKEKLMKKDTTNDSGPGRDAASDGNNVTSKK